MYSSLLPYCFLYMISTTFVAVEKSSPKLYSFSSFTSKNQKKKQNKTPKKRLLDHYS